MPNPSNNDFPFYERLWDFYLANKKIIRRSYKDASKRYLDYNDKEKNPNAFLREPQFHALEMYVLIKEFFNNEHLYKIFAAWYNHSGKFEGLKYDVSLSDSREISLFEFGTKESYEEIFTHVREGSNGDRPRLSDVG